MTTTLFKRSYEKHHLVISFNIKEGAKSGETNVLLNIYVGTNSCVKNAYFNFLIVTSKQYFCCLLYYN